MQDTVEVIINADGKTCTTVNPFGETKTPCFGKPYCCYADYCKAIAWQQAEKERKTYEIVKKGCCIKMINCTFPNCDLGITPGTIHKGQIINNKAVIL